MLILHIEMDKSTNNKFTMSSNQIPTCEEIENKLKERNRTERISRELRMLV